MKHAEYMYLVLRARDIRQLAQRASEEGEEFVPANAFVPLESGLHAQALIQAIRPGEPEVCVLRLRHPDDGKDRTDLLRKTQHAFFVGPYHVVPAFVKEAGWCEYLAYSHKIPEPPAAPPPAPSTP